MLPENTINTLGQTFSWAQYIANPVGLINHCLRTNYQKHWQNLFVQIWIFPIFISVMVDAVALNWYGIEVPIQVAFTFLYFVCVILKFLVELSILYFIPTVFRLRRDWGVICVALTITVIYSPIYSWLNLSSFHF